MKLSKLKLKALFSDLLRKRITDSMMDTLIESLWRDPVSGGTGASITFSDTADVNFTKTGDEVSAVTIGSTGDFYDSKGNKLEVSNGLIKSITQKTFTLIVINGEIEHVPTTEETVVSIQAQINDLTALSLVL